MALSHEKVQDSKLIYSKIKRFSKNMTFSDIRVLLDNCLIDWKDWKRCTSKVQGDKISYNPSLNREEKSSEKNECSIYKDNLFKP